jgi:putative N6-adenine-specific DNA methylase
LDDVYRANLHLRTASRIVVRIATFRATTFFELERRAKRIPWSEYVVRGRPVRFRVTCRKSRLYHSDAVVQRLAESVAPVVSDAALVGVATGDDEQDVPDAQLFIVRVDHDQVTISADSSGVLLHRRGYRQAVAKAPLRETLAAAMLLASGWDCRAPLIDPMCGAGTIPIEAALLARCVAPGLRRRFAFAGWPGYDGRRWEQMLSDAEEQILPRAPGVIQASDRDAGAIQATMENADRAEVAADLDISQRSISAMESLGERGWLITNPPYGVRVGDTNVRNLYAQFGKVVRVHLPDWNIGMLSADVALERETNISFKRSFGTSNGGIPVRFINGIVNPSGGEG